MGAIATVTSKGQVTLPANIRAEYDIEAGDQILFFRDLAGRPRFAVRRKRRLAFGPLIKWDGPPVPVAAMDPGLSDDEIAQIMSKAGQAK